MGLLCHPLLLLCPESAPCPGRRPPVGAASRFIPLRPRSGEPAADHCPTGDLAGGLIWSSQSTGLLLQLHRIVPDSHVRKRRVFPKTSWGWARPFKRFCPPTRVSVCSNRSSSLSFNMAVGRRTRLSPPTTSSFVTCGSLDRRHMRFSPTASRPCTGRFPDPFIRPCGLPHPAQGFPSWWTMSPPPDLFGTPTQVCPLDLRYLNFSLYKGKFKMLWGGGVVFVILSYQNACYGCENAENWTWSEFFYGGLLRTPALPFLFSFLGAAANWMGRRLLQTPEASAYLRAAGCTSMAACPGNSVFVFAFGLVFPYSFLFKDDEWLLV